MHNSQKNKISKSPRLNALTVRRSTEDEHILFDPEDLHIPTWMHKATDPIFSDLYKKFLAGKIPAYTTRFPIAKVKVGFYLVRNNYEYCCDAPPSELIEEFETGIRGGDRPTLHLYPNPNPQTNSIFPFLCPDDAVLYLAYINLKIESIPATIFAPGNYRLPFSTMEIKSPKGLEILEPRIQRLISAEKPKEVATLIGNDIPENFSNVLSILLNNLDNSIKKIRQFHLSPAQAMHYHHMVFSAAVRMRETLSAIEILIQQNLWYQALSLLRVLYEIHLNFYFDWLQPQSNYKFLAAAAVMDTAAIHRLKEKTEKELISKGTNRALAKIGAGMVWKPVIYASTVSEKAKLPMVGILYHQDIYHFLSRVSHQDFEVASLHANRFDDELFTAIEDDAKKTYLRFMDLIVAEFCSCVDGDIGRPTVP